MNIHKNKNKHTHTQIPKNSSYSVKCKVQIAANKRVAFHYFGISKFIHNISNYVENDKLEGEGEVRGIVEQFFFFTKRDLMPPPKNRGSMNRSATSPTI